MSGQVRVEDLEVFGLFRAALLKFAQTVDQSLASADSQVARARSWLEGEQASYWQHQLKKRIDAVAQAREAVRKKKLFKDSTGRTPSAVEEEKALARCIAAVEEANAKIEAVRKWLPRLEKESELYRGGVSRLSQSTANEIPRAVALLDRLAAALEQYVQIETPEAGATGTAVFEPGGESVARPVETAPAPAEPDPAATGPASAPPAGEGAAGKPAPTREGRDVGG